MPAYNAVPTIDAAATFNKETNGLYISLVNRDESQSADIALHGTNRDGYVYLISGDTSLATNTADKPENVIITKHKWTPAKNILAIPPHSFAMVVVRNEE